MDVSQMTIGELESAIIANETQVKTLRAEQKAMHDAAETKRSALPPVGGLGQVMKPGGTDWAAFFKQFPAEAIDAFKGIIQGGK